MDQNDIRDAVAMLSRGEQLTFASRLNRDEVFAAAKAAGVGPLKRSSISNQILDPRYTFEGRHLPDLGLGNDKQMYGALYDLECHGFQVSLG
jgi:hypothetical protein